MLVSVLWEIRGCWLGAVCICALEAVHNRHGWVDWAPEMPKTEKKVVAAIVAKQKQSDLLSLSHHFAEIIKLFVWPQHPLYVFMRIFGINYCRQKCVVF